MRDLFGGLIVRWLGPGKASNCASTVWFAFCGETSMEDAEQLLLILWRSLTHLVKDDNNRS